MKTVAPDSIKLCRVYFTEFDRITYSQVAWTPDDVDGIRRNLDRKLKLLALTKGHVVIAASHLLESELAHEAMLEHPRLFSEGIVVPALRSEFADFEQMLDSKLSEGHEADVYEGDVRREMARMLDGTVATAVGWDVRKTSDWFKARMIADLTDKGSLLGTCLHAQGCLVTPQLVGEIESKDTLSRKDVYLAAKATQDKKLWDTVCNYADFVYYLSGAHAVSSEGILPQENLLDFRLSDMAEGRTSLTDARVFFKIFLDLVRTQTGVNLPVDLLDRLSIEDVLDLHHIAITDRFVQKYNQIQQRTKDALAIRDPERLVLLMDELAEFEVDLHHEYEDALLKELPGYRREHKASLGLELLSAIAKLVMPAWHAATVAGEIVVSGLSLIGAGQLPQRTTRRAREAVASLNVLIDRRPLDERPVFLAFVDRLKKRYADTLS